MATTLNRYGQQHTPTQEKSVITDAVSYSLDKASGINDTQIQTLASNIDDQDIFSKLLRIDGYTD